MSKLATPAPLRRSRSNGSVVTPPPELVTDVGGFLASSRPLDAHFDAQMGFDTIQQATHARMLTEQTIASLERQLKAEHIKLRCIENVEVSLRQCHPTRLVSEGGEHGGEEHARLEAMSAPPSRPPAHELRSSSSLTILPGMRTRAQ